MWYNKSFLRKWWQRLIFRIRCEWTCASQAISRFVGDSEKLAWWFLICVFATHFSKNSMQEIGDLIHA